VRTHDIAHPTFFEDAFMASSGAAVNVPFFKKGKTRPTTSRKRSVSPAAAAATNTSDQRPPLTKSQVVHPTRKSQTSLLSAGTKRTFSQRDEGADGNEEEEGGREKLAVHWTASGSHVNTALEIIAGDEKEELLEKRRMKEYEAAGGVEEAPDGVYMGQKAYKSHIKKNTEVPKSMRIGPQRSTGTIRTVTIVDYQPDVCKDYKGPYDNHLPSLRTVCSLFLLSETGYCGFGDTCKFLHDRGTCKSLPSLVHLVFF
jgi:RING finger protein 113A